MTSPASAPSSAPALEEEGYRVLEASNGKEALAAVRGGPVDLVITDLVMPEQEGIETVQALRKEAPAIGIIAMSGGFGAQFLKIALALGANAVMSKPVEAEELVRKVAEVLRSLPQNEKPRTRECGSDLVGRPPYPVTARLAESQRRAVAGEQEVRSAPLCRIADVPFAAGVFRTQSQSPLAARHQVAGAIAGILHQASGGRTGNSAIVESRHGTPFHAPGPLAQYVRHYARGRPALEDLRVHRVTIRIVGNLQKYRHSRSVRRSATFRWRSPLVRYRERAR
ncbi:MAG: response regulator [Ignavibacteriota bacterium]